MNEQAKYTVTLEFQTTGADKEVNNLRELQRGVDDLARNEGITQKSSDKLSRSIHGLGGAMGDASGNTRRAEDSIISLRYANYDLATTLLGTAAAITAVGVASVTAFASQERAFTDVERTLEGGTLESVEALRQSFIDLSTEIPRSFNEISEIATLGNQLGVASEDLEAFTRTVAAFATVTGISADSASQAFGKLGNLLSVQVDDYDRLGSSIALVGRTTAATEAQIISIASEIAPAAAAAGLSADAVIGLSGALGSLRVPPERSRSTILQFFETLNMAVANGGQDLENFARVVGTTSTELENLVRSGQGEEILSRFISSASTKDTVEITQALQELGLAGLRTNPTIRALAGNMELFNSSIRTGKQGFAENTELQRQMALITDDLASKFQMLLNAAVNFAAEVGSELAPTLGRLIDVAKDGLVALTEFSQTPVGEALTRTVSVIAGAIAVWAALRGVIALATASTLAFQFVVQGLGGVGIVSGLKGLAGSIIGIRDASAGATGAVLTLRSAILALGRAVVIGAVFAYIAEWIFNTGGAAQETGNVLIWLSDIGTQVFSNLAQSVAEFAPALAMLLTLIGSGLGSNPLSKALRGAGEGLRDWGKGLSDAQNSIFDVDSAMSGLAGQFEDFSDVAPGAASDLDDFGGAAGDAAREVRTLVDYANDLRTVWDRAFEIRFSSQSTLDTITSSFIRIREATEESSKRIRDLNNDIRGLTSDIDIQEYFLSVAIEYGDVQRAEAIEAELAKMRAELADKTAELQKQQDLASKSLEGNSKGAIENRKTISDLVQQYQAHIGALAASGMSQTQLAQATESLRQDFIRQATQLGYSRAELYQYERAFDDVRTAINLVPRNITVSASTDPAQQAFNEMQASIQRAHGSLNSLRSALNTSLPTPWAGPVNKNLMDQLFIQWIADFRRQYGYNPYQSANQLAQLRRTWDRGLLNYWSGGHVGGSEGFTGRGGMYEPMGVVHGGEYVIPKRDVNQATGLPYADALGRLMNGIPSHASGGPVGRSGGSAPLTSVSLTAGTIQALAQAVQPYLIVDGKQLGEVTSKAYTNESTVGAY